MTLQVTGQVAGKAATPMRFFHERYFGRPCCPKCGEPLMAAEYPEFSECRSGDEIRNYWRCDSCDHRFDTDGEVPAAYRPETGSAVAKIRCSQRS